MFKNEIIIKSTQTKSVDYFLKQKKYTFVYHEIYDQLNNKKKTFDIESISLEEKINDGFQVNKIEKKNPIYELLTDIFLTEYGK